MLDLGIKPNIDVGFFTGVGVGKILGRLSFHI